jgi:hypothetical protein
MSNLFNANGNYELHGDYMDETDDYYYDIEICPDNGEVLRLDIQHYTPEGLRPVDDDTYQFLEMNVREHARDILKWG